MPIKLTGMGDVQTKAGYSKTNWEDFTLCEVFAEHFDNTEGDIGPIYIVNVLNPDIHRDTEPITESLTVKKPTAWKSRARRSFWTPSRSMTWPRAWTTP